MVSEPELEEKADGQHEPRPDVVAPSTVGTGSALAVGCVVAVLVLVLIALAVRWIGGGW